MEEAVKLLAPLPSTGSDCPYTLVWLNRDTCHAPLPKEGHLSIQVVGGIGSAACRSVSQLQVCQFLSSGSQIVYPVGLNGCEVPVMTSPPEPITKGVNLLSSKPIFLKVDIPQFNTEVPEVKALPLGSHCPSISIASLVMEVMELLLQVGLDMSGCASGNSTPKRLEPMVLVTPLPTKLEDFPWTVDTSSHVSTLMMLRWRTPP